MSFSLIRCLVPSLCLWLATPPSLATAPGSAKLRPSDCRPRNADSTCATAVAGASAVLPAARDDAILYDGPLGGVPASGYAYWGFDFIADASGTPSPVRGDEFINRSGAPVTITLSFTIPTDHFCGKDCLPGLQFQVGRAWHKIDPPYVVSGNGVSLASTFQPGQGYGWVIALWQSTRPRLTVTVPKNAGATLEGVGLPGLPSIATEIPRAIGTCTCPDGSAAACSDGSHFSNGLLGAWSQTFDTYQRSGAFSNCVIDR